MFFVPPPKRFRTVPSLPTTRTFELKPKMNFIVVPAVWRPLHLVVMGATSTAALVRLLIALVNDVLPDVLHGTRYVPERQHYTTSVDAAYDSFRRGRVDRGVEVCL